MFASDLSRHDFVCWLPATRLHQLQLLWLLLAPTFWLVPAHGWVAEVATKPLSLSIPLSRTKKARLRHTKSHGNFDCNHLHWNTRRPQASVLFSKTSIHDDADADTNEDDNLPDCDSTSDKANPFTVRENENNNNSQKDNPSSERLPDGTYSARYLQDNGLVVTTEEDGYVTARPRQWQAISHADLNDTYTDGSTKNSRNKSRQSKQVHTTKKEKKQQPTKAKGRESVSASASVTSPKQVVPFKTNNKKSQTLTNNVKSTPEKPTTTLNQMSTLSSSSSSSLSSSSSSLTLDHSPGKQYNKAPIKEDRATVVPSTGFNVVLTHATADFDSLAAAVGLARLWTQDPESLARQPSSLSTGQNSTPFHTASHVPTFVVLPRGAHPGVARFLALHKHLFPIRSLKSLPDDLSGLNRLALVDAQRRERLGPAEVLLKHAKRVTVVDHHIDQESDIPATDYVVDKVGSVSTLLVEFLRKAGVALTEAEATLLALGIHADTGSLCFDSTTTRDAISLAWCLEQGASQAAIAEHAHPFLSREQQGVLTQALVNLNSTEVHGVTLSTVLLTADGFINGLAAVAQDALELSSSDVFLLGLVYEAQPGGRRKKGRKKDAGPLLTSRFLPDRNPSEDEDDNINHNSNNNSNNIEMVEDNASIILTTSVVQNESQRRQRLQQAFSRKDTDNSGFLDLKEVKAALSSSGVIASTESIQNLFESMDTNEDGRIDFEEFVQFADRASEEQEEAQQKKSTTLILIGRAKAGSNLKNIKLNSLLERYGGGGHAKAASATVRLNSEVEAKDILQGLVDELVETGLQEQLTVGDFMTAPVLSVKVDMTESQVEDLFTRYDVRALPVVDDNNDVIGLVSYKEVASAKQRLWNKEQKRLRREKEAAERGEELPEVPPDRRAGTAVKGWMLQHIKVVEASKTMAEVEFILLENDVGCIPVVADGTRQLVGMVTRTDLLRQHRYYNSLYYHNKGYADSIANRKNIIELRKRLKRFDDE